MEELLSKLEMLKKDKDIIAECGNRVLMNNKNTQVAMPYISYNPVVTGKAIGHYDVGASKHLLDGYTCQVNLYCKNGYKFINLYNAIKKCMSTQGFKTDTEFIDSTDNGDTWICFRFSITILTK